MEKGEGFFTINEKTSVVADGDARAAGDYLINIINASSAFQLSHKQEGSGGIIRLQLHSEDSLTENYELIVNESEIVLQANSRNGLMLGVQTLRQLLPASVESRKHDVESWAIPSVRIKDNPRFSWRGMHLDVSRHFFSPDFLKSFIDRLALYKFNKLHLHLTDDQGWRLEIKKFPQLTSQGAWRLLNSQDSTCIKLSPNNSDFELPKEFLKSTDRGLEYGGFYSQDEMKDIIRYADARSITIVPEIDMPGHMSAAISEFPQLTCVDAGGWGKLFSTPLCPCEETTYSFIDDVVKEVAALFPAEYIHIGADEVDEKTWRSSNSCKKLLREKGIKPDQLHSYFVNRVNQIVNRYGKKTMAWDEVMDGDPDRSIAVMYWRGWVPQAPIAAANGGHTVVMSPTSHCYFDYEPDAHSLKNMYNYEPVPEGVIGDHRNNIIGVQANIWSEYIPTPARLDYMTMPRMIALSEVAWTEEKRDWDDFSLRLKDHFERWDALGIAYRLPDIGNMPAQKVFIDSTVFQVSLPFGVHELRYTVDGSEPTTKSLLYQTPVIIDSSITVKTLTLGVNQRRGNRKDIRFDKQSYLVAANVDKSSLKEGVRCSYYEEAFRSVSEVDEAEPKETVILSRIEFPAHRRAELFGLKFDGFLYVQKDGIYSFYLSSDDGSSLTIGDRLVVNNDGPHGEKEVGGQVALQKGYHPYTLRYFDGGGGNKLTLQYQPPGQIVQDIPSSGLKIKP